MGFASGRFLFAFADIVANSLPLPCTTPWIVSFFFWLWFPVLQRRARFREFKGKRVVDLQPRAGTNLFFLLLPSLFSPGALEHYDMCGHVPYCRTLPFIVQRECVVWAGPVLSNDAQAKYKAANLMSSIIINKDCLLSENYTVKTKANAGKDGDDVVIPHRFWIGLWADWATLEQFKGREKAPSNGTVRIKVRRWFSIGFWKTPAVAA